MTMSNIEVRQLNVSFETTSGRTKAVKDVEVSFLHHQVTGIIGESGSGKSLLGMSMLGLLSSEALITGECIYDKQNLLVMNKEKLRKIRGKEIAFIPQNPINALNPVLTIGRQLIEHTVLHKKICKKEARTLSKEYLAAFGLTDSDKIMKLYPFQLSGGMNQIVLFVMGVICEPDFIIADEPTKGLDSKLRRQVYNRLEHIKNNFVRSMIIITHDLYFARKICDEIVVMYRGEIVEVGPSASIIDNPIHPYTKKLVASTVKNGMHPIQKLKNTDAHKACSFFNYCEDSCESCLNPIDMKLVSGHKVRCIL